MEGSEGHNTGGGHPPESETNGCLSGAPQLGPRNCQHFCEMLESLDEVFWVTSMDWTQVFYVSPAFEKVWGIPRTAVRENPLAWFEAIHPEDRDGVRAAFFAKEAPALRKKYRIQRPDGSIRWISARGVPLRDSNGKINRYAGVARDITEHEQARIESDRLQRMMLTISEREKQVLAQELHDGLCQHLAGTALVGSLLQRRLAQREDPETETVRQISSLLMTGVEEARKLSRLLHPVRPESEGLMNGLASLAQTTTRLLHVECTFEPESMVLIEDPSVATHLFRIAQEAVNNAVKRGQASRVVIELKKQGEEIELVIRDNGTGMVSEPSTGEGTGLQVMRYRATLIGAEFGLASAPGGGTEVRILRPGK